MLRVCLDDCEVLQLLFLAAEGMSRGSAPPEATQLFNDGNHDGIVKDRRRSKRDCHRDIIPPSRGANIGPPVHEGG